MNYPTGVRMRSYRRRPLRRGRFRRRKYHNHKVHEDGFTFDSQVELQYYNLLKLEHKTFRLHPRFEILPHYDHDGIKCRKRNYTSDFAIYDNNGRIKEVDDVKGIRQIPSYDTLRFSLFERKYNIPVVIIRKKHGRFTRTRKCF